MAEEVGATKREIRHILLDTNVFARLIGPKASNQVPQVVLDELNSRIASVIVGIPGLLPKYLGLDRPSWMTSSADYEPELLAVGPRASKRQDDAMGTWFEEACAKYAVAVAGQVPSYSRLAEERLMKYTSVLPEAQKIARAVLFTEGQSLTDEMRIEELAIFYALDEIAYHLRSCLHSKGQINWRVFFCLAGVAAEYRHFNFYRLFESLYEALKVQAKYLGYRERMRYLQRLNFCRTPCSPDEFDDGLWLWQAFQGNADSSGAVPVTVLTADRKGADRHNLLSALLRESWQDGRTIIDTLREVVCFKPGEILVFNNSFNAPPERRKIVLLNEP
ncbi:MAG: hypothetical protein JW384_00726 [Nitrosomonadaceae bacterium]|nr:hypothetical protein [Nitrosomonadaceae bacterium]